ncbi:MAG: translation initiation factor IF-2 [Spirochaetaceae bacterium]|jgi:translation initiation factor IF-2|nr:translation initiation factor IF-2 [Spirochaetaceae bacterium]
MAAETENTQKPKSELIKRPKTEAVTENGGKPAELERKKVVKLKKKPQANPAPAGAERPTLKVKVVARATQPQAGQQQQDVKPRPAAPQAEAQSPNPPQDAPPPVAPQLGATNTGQPQDAAPETGNIQKPAATQPDTSKAGSPQAGSASRPTAPQAGGAAAEDLPVNRVSVYKETARPAVQAGRVGGKFFGPRPQRGGATNEGSASGDSASGARNDGRKPASYVGRGNQRRYGGQGGQSGFSGQGGQGGGRFSGGGPRGNAGPFRPAGQTGGPFRPAGFANRPRPGSPTQTQSSPTDNKGAVKRTFKAKKPSYQRRDREVEIGEKLHQGKKRSAQMANPVPKSIDIMEIVSVSDLARKMNLKASDLISKLMSMGQMVTINQQIDSETAAIIAAEFGAEVNIVSLYDETLIETEADDASSMTPRPPVVTVMGHVDHGKTKLLDAIRSADVVSGEFGGITQHIGAYMVETPRGNITFLDTPGHEAFTRMRSRGAQVTDIVVLVVAADDGVMPQTIEAINHAKEADVPIIVAINKIDKPDANPDKARSQLSEYGLQPEEWGGQTMFVELSALKKEGIDDLIEAILLQAEILDLRVNYNRSAEGKILESRIDHGRGIVATLLVEKGVLEIGDSFVAGVWPGKVRAIFNDKGARVERATPSMPVEVLGFEGIPNAGDPLQVVEDEKTARGFSAKRQELKRFEDAKNIRKITLDNLYDTISDGAIQVLKVIIKGDVQGSVEALRASLEKLSTKEVRLAVIQALPGAINEGDIDLASASNAILIGFNVRPTPKAKALAEQEKVDIRRYNIIYRVVEDMQKAMEGMLKPDTKEEIIADVETREVFKISKIGVIAGCYVRSGTVKRGASLNVIRGDTVIHTGKIASLRRFKDDVKEVSAGFECGIIVDGFDDIKLGDEFEVFETVEIARKL